MNNTPEYKELEYVLSLLQKNKSIIKPNTNEYCKLFIETKGQYNNSYYFASNDFCIDSPESKYNISLNIGIYNSTVAICSKELNFYETMMTKNSRTNHFYSIFSNAFYFSHKDVFETNEEYNNLNPHKSEIFYFDNFARLPISNFNKTFDMFLNYLLKQTEKIISFKEEYNNYLDNLIKHHL